MNRKTVLITGATSGIGLACARIFYENDFNLILCGRRTERLEALKASFKGIQTDILSFDIRHKQEVDAALQSINQPIDILVNNAGNAHGLDLIYEGNVEDWEQMIDINVKGLLYVTRGIAPQMVARGSGHIINIGSIAGLEVYPKGNVYSATKHAVVALSESMRLDMLGKNIKVSCINPGMVETEFSEVRFKGDKEKASSVYKNIQPLTGDDIARTVFYVATQPAHVNITEITVMPLAQASATMVHRME